MSDKLHLRVLRIVALGAIVFTVIASIISYFYIHAIERVSMQRSIEQLFSTVQRSAEIATYLDSKELAEEIVDSLMGNDIVSGVMLFSTNNMRVLSNPQISDNNHTLTFTLFAPFSASEHVGELLIQPNTELLNSRVLSSAFERMLILTAQIVVIAILALVIMLRMLTYPIQAIANNLHNIVPGDDNNLGSPKGHEEDEIGHLVADINKLLNAARTTIRQEQHLRTRVEHLEKHFRLLFEQASAGIFLLDKNFCLHSVNQAFKNIAGIAQDERREGRQNLYLPSLFYDSASVEELLRHALKTQQQAAYDLRLVMPRNGEERWLHCLFSIVKNEQGEYFIEGLAIDITERTAEMERILFEARHDALTQLLNRRAGESMLESMLTLAENNHTQAALLLLDLDHFKYINDTHGHDAGDKVLIEVAHRMRTMLRQEDIVVRLGGDEFIIGFPIRDEQSNEVDLVIKKLKTQLSKSIEIRDHCTVMIGASIGAALFPRDGKNLETLIASADNAMYQIKKARKTN